MVASIGSALASSGLSWSVTGKDRNSDGKITREEFKLPVEPGTTSITPADLRSVGSLDDMFSAYDRNGDSVIDEREAQQNPPATSHFADRFTPNWADRMSPNGARAYAAIIDADNARLLQEWGVDLQQERSA